MKKLLLGLFVAFCLTGCCLNNEHDNVTISNKTAWKFDDIVIEAKGGYFYHNHKKFIVDENTVGITIYFTNNDEWSSEVVDGE